MKYMQQWLEDRRQPVSMGHAHMEHMGNMKGMDMGSMPMMPGMLTPQQMQALSKATGRGIRSPLLTGMIQHHTGALVMVRDLFDTPGAGQDAVLFDFATDVDNTQRVEINIMQGMLLKEKKMIPNELPGFLRRAAAIGALTVSLSLSAFFPVLCAAQTAAPAPPKIHGIYQSAFRSRRSPYWTQRQDLYDAGQKQPLD